MSKNLYYPHPFEGRILLNGTHLKKAVQHLKLYWKINPLEMSQKSTEWHIIRYLREKPLTVTALSQLTGKSVSFTTQRLTMLKDAQIVTCTSEGKWRIYEINEAGYEGFNTFGNKLKVSALGILNHKGRLDILQFIIDSVSATETEIYKGLGIKQTDANIFLKMLKNAGLVECVVSQIDKRSRINYVNVKELENLQTLFTEMFEFIEA